MIKFLHLKGTDYEMGYTLGVHFKTSINSRIDKFKKMLEDKEISSYVSSIEKKIKDNYPSCLDEIYGRADGAGVDRKEMLLMFFLELIKKKAGCTTVSYKRNDEIGFAHNEDDVGYTEDDAAVVKYDYGTDWAVGYVLYDRLLGTTAGYNSKGIVHSSNYIFPDEQCEDNVSRFVLCKYLVRMGSIEEIENFLKNNSVYSPFSFNVFDLNTNEVVNFEKDINSLYRKDIDGKFARSNHFIQKESKLLTASENTKYRYQRSNELIEKINIDKICLDDLFEILNDSTDDPIHSINKKNETIFTLGIDNKTKKIKMINRFSNETVIFDYNEYKTN